MKRLFVGGILVAALLGISALAERSLVAQRQQTTPHWISVNIVNVRPERLDDWLTVQRTETIPALQKIGVRERGVWMSVVGESYQYVVSTPMAKMADRDQPGPFVRALGQEGARAYNAKLRQMVESQRTMIAQAMPELGIPPAANFEPKLAIVTFSSVAPGRGPEFENYLKTDVLPALRKVQATGYVHLRGVFGGDANEYVTVRYIDTFADVDKGPLLTQAVGAAAAAKINAKLATLVTRQERRVYRFMPELSFRTKTTS